MDSGFFFYNSSLTVKDMTTLTELNKKGWYLYLKVIYVLFYIPCFILLYVVIHLGCVERGYVYDPLHILNDNPWNITNCILYSLILMIGYLLVMELIKRGFYYVLIGKVFPKE